VPDARATIGLIRSKEHWWFGVQPFKIELDGEFVGSVYGGKSQQFEVAPGSHRVRVRFRAVVWSDELVVPAAKNSTTWITCRTDRFGYPHLDVSTS
jgi:hypothetical protein